MKILRSFKLYTTTYLNLIQTKYLNKKNKEKNWFWVQRPESQPAVIIIATMNDKLVVIKEFRIPIKDYEYGLPAGLIEPNQTIKQTVILELRQETGLDVDHFITEPSPIVYNSSGLTDEGCSIVYVEATGTLSKIYQEDSEEIEPFLMSKEEIKNLMDDARAKKIHVGAKAWIVFENFIKG
jgi:ADP-ribose pyrophosphatase